MQDACLLLSLPTCLPCPASALHEAIRSLPIFHPLPHRHLFAVLFSLPTAEAECKDSWAGYIEVRFNNGTVVTHRRNSGVFWDEYKKESVCEYDGTVIGSKELCMPAKADTAALRIVQLNMDRDTVNKLEPMIWIPMRGKCGEYDPAGSPESFPLLRLRKITSRFNTKTTCHVLHYAFTEHSANEVRGGEVCKETSLLRLHQVGGKAWA